MYEKIDKEKKNGDINWKGPKNRMVIYAKKEEKTTIFKKNEQGEWKLGEKHSKSWRDSENVIIFTG